MRYLYFFRPFIVVLFTSVLFSCLPPPDDANPAIQPPEPTVDVELSIASWQQDDLSQLVLTGRAKGVPPCAQCDGGYLTSLPFGSPSSVYVGSTGGGRTTHVMTEPKMLAGGQNFYRYSYVDEDGYANSVVARYKSGDSEKTAAVYHQPASENDTHLIFVTVLQEPIDDVDTIEIDYPEKGGSEEDDGSQGQNDDEPPRLGNVSSITTKSLVTGEQEITFKIELDEADEDVEGLEYAPIEVTFPTLPGSARLNFNGVVLDDDGLDPSITLSPPPVLDLQKTDSCPLNQGDRLGSSGDLRFSLQWDNPRADLNLWVKDPCDNVSSHLASGLQCGDYTSTRETTEGREKPSENILWSAGAETGEYAFAIEHFSGAESDFTLCIYRDGDVEGYQGRASGGAISDIKLAEVNVSDTGRFAPALATKMDDPDFDYAGEVADSLPVVNFTAEPVTVVQTVDGDEPRAEFQFQFDVLNLSNECQGQLLEAHLVDEDGNREKALVVGNSTYKKQLSEGRDEVLKVATIPPSNLIHFSPGELESRRWNIDVPISDSAKRYQVELSFYIEKELSPLTFYVFCLSPLEGVPEISSTTVQIDVPGREDLQTIEGGPDVDFVYPYVVRRHEGVTQSRFVNDKVYIQHSALPATQTPDGVELHINRELYRRDVPFSAEAPSPTEFNGWFVTEGVSFDFVTYYSPVEVRYMYSHEFNVQTKDGPRAASYRSAKSGRVDILGALQRAPMKIERETLIYYTGVWDMYTDDISYDQEDYVSLPSVVHFANYRGTYFAGGSAANDIYHIQRDVREGYSGGTVIIGYSEAATNGFDILSFSSEVNIDGLEYYRRDNDLWIVRNDFLDQDWIKALLEEHSGSVGAVLDDIASRERDLATSEAHLHFRVVIEQYFAEESGLIDEFRWKNEPYITHDEIVDQAIEF